MKLETSTRCFLMACIALPLIAISAALNTAIAQSKISGPPKIYSCGEVRKLYPELEKLSRDEVRKYLWEKFLSQYNSKPMEAYTYQKYYVCRFPNDKSETVNYSRRWIAAFERQLMKLKSKGGK